MTQSNGFTSRAAAEPYGGVGFFSKTFFDLRLEGLLSVSQKNPFDSQQSLLVAF